MHSFLAVNSGLIEQDIGAMLADQLSVEENLKLAMMRKHPGFTALPKVGPLPDFVAQLGIDQKKPVYVLSGGQRQIVGILMMLQKAKKILLLDEPTAALDEENAQQVLSFLDTIATKTETIILIISHDKELVKQYCQGSYYKIFENPDGSRSMQNINLFLSRLIEFEN